MFHVLLASVRKDDRLFYLFLVDLGAMNKAPVCTPIREKFSSYRSHFELPCFAFWHCLPLTFNFTSSMHAISKRQGLYALSTEWYIIIYVYVFGGKYEDLLTHSVKKSINKNTSVL